MFNFDLQLFGGGGKSGGTTTSTYTPSEQEETLQNMAVINTYAAQPTALKSLWAVGKSYDPSDFAYNKDAVNYQGLYNTGQSQVSTGQNLLANAANGQLSDAYKQNMTDAIKSGVENTVGSMVNKYGSAGTLNSSVTNKALSDIEGNVANAVAQNYNTALNTQANTANSVIGNAGAGIQLGSAAQQAATTPIQNNLGIGTALQNAFFVSPLSALRNTGETTQESTTPWYNVIGNAAGTAIGAKMAFG